MMIFNGASMKPYDDLDPLVQGDAHWKTMKEDPEPEILNQIEYFSRVLRDRLDVPVGILHPICLGVLGQTWMSRETLEAIPSDKGGGNGYQALFATSEATFAKNPLKSWDGFEKAEAEWRKAPTGAWPPGRDPITLFGYPTVGYNSKIHPLAPFAFRGVQFFAPPIANCGGAKGIAAMVKQWRTLFGQDFYFVNCTNGNRWRSIGQPPLAPAMFDNPSEDAVYDSLKLFGGEKREDVVNTKDLGSAIVHNFQRAEAGRRLAMAALALAYGQQITADDVTPRMAETKIQGNKAIVRFDFVGNGIVYQPSIDGISGVYMQGNQGLGQWAQVKVLGKDTLEFSHPAIANIKTVAYGQAFNSHETLFNSAGMPCAQFIVNPPVGKPEPTGNNPQPPYQMVSMQGEDKNHRLTNEAVKGAVVSLAHVRRSGYVFQIVGEETLGLDMKVMAGKDNGEAMGKSTATVPVTAYVPKEWKGCEVMLGDTYFIKNVHGVPVSKGMIKTGGKLVKTAETTKDGAHFVTFDAPIDSTWMIVAEKGKAVEFRKINRY